MSKKEKNMNKDLEAEVRVQDTGREQSSVADTEPKAKESASDALTAQEARIEALEEENKRLAKELSDEKESFLRKVADMDNYRKRLVREKEAAIQFANERLLNDLIPILDDFERAIDAGEQSGDIGAYADGVKLIQKRLLDVLDRNWGLKRMDDLIGKEFSPHEHEAMMMEEGEHFDTETVLAELQKGYYLHDRVLRTAKVKVGKPL
ncbi:MAG: nucleotide exchange factor GrpE [Sphaerochaetaceae bacterium]|jgi:molecular chaperone GrpE|nr:nucleotide exchange factor GrpE [Sphaerochaetaceae bacterium]MDD3940843.1 nucleotide exchange factor GrpE [Sphaerochaetaceae bacterium]MDX9939471.1 nucleotide exchange factor GrpE [Sphaerochaetaceae bacterium]